MNQLRARGRHRRSGVFPAQLLVIIILLAIIIFLGVLVIKSLGGQNTPAPITSPKATQSAQNTDDTQTTPTTPPTPTSAPLPVLAASAGETSQLSLYDFTYKIQADGQTVPNYTSPDTFNFGDGKSYTDLEGVITFRGSNFRSNAAYGSVEVTQKLLTDMWNVPTYSIKRGISNNYKNSWTGSGWTGQPILVKWPQETKNIMNMYDSAKQKADLVEVIYATMDGNIYFLDMETGEPTRDKLFLNVPFKGAGSLDPRGYPLLYLGQGDHYEQEGRRARALVLSLIDCKILYSFGEYGDSFALREWTAYDSSALVCAEADTLVYPGENGILYAVKLNTNYNPTAGTISVSPEVVKMRYTSRRDAVDKYWLGYEGSAAAFGHYVFLTENSGMMHCVDLNTMSVVWVQDIWDDTNCSPTFEIADDGKCYLYIGNTLDKSATWRGTGEEVGTGKVAMFKIDASNGDIVWKVEREVSTTHNVTGGIMTSAVLGENKQKGLVFITFASYGNGNHGDMVAINTSDGSIVWETKLSAYTWSSPSIVYNSNGDGYLVQCNYSGNVYLIDAADGTILNKFNIESNIEASPAIFNNMIVIGTRVKGIWGIKIS